MKLLTSYKNKPMRFVLRDGGVVVGEEVDENNQLHYIIKRGDTLTSEKASGSKNIPIYRILPSGKRTITIDTKQKTE